MGRCRQFALSRQSRADRTSRLDCFVAGRGSENDLPAGERMARVRRSQRGMAMNTLKPVRLRQAWQGWPKGHVFTAMSAAQAQYMVAAGQCEYVTKDFPA